MKAQVFDVLPEEYKPVRVSCNVKIPKMACKYLKKEIRWFWKTELDGIKKQEKHNPKEKVLSLNSVKLNQNKSKFFKGTCKNCGKYGHSTSNFLGNKNRVNEKNIEGKPRFNGECHNCGRKGHRAVDFWPKRNKRR